jgi:hypothetical protein
MTTTCEQSFPQAVNGQVRHKRWVVDTATAARLAGWGNDGTDRLDREVAEMGSHFPRWVTVITQGRDVLTCAGCGGMLVLDRGVRCVACEEVARRLPVDCGPGWFGLMPPIGVDSLAKVRERLGAKPPPRHVVGHREGMGTFILVPLLVSYPRNFPLVPPRVHYLPGFFKIPGMPADACSHSYHLLGGGLMCLFAPGDWRQEMTCREVLQQRGFPHVVKMLAYANGKRDAFAKVS